MKSYNFSCKSCRDGAYFALNLVKGITFTSSPAETWKQARTPSMKVDHEVDKVHMDEGRQMRTRDAGPSQIFQVGAS